MGKVQRVLPWAGNIGLGFIIMSKTEEMRESGGRGMICRGLPYENVIFRGGENISISLASFPLISG